MEFLTEINWLSLVEKIGIPGVFCLVLLRYIAKAAGWIADKVILPLVDECKELIQSVRVTNETNSQSFSKLASTHDNIITAIETQTAEIKSCFSNYQSNGAVETKEPHRTG